MQPSELEQYTVRIKAQGKSGMKMLLIVIVYSNSRTHEVH